jgi:ATP-dependent RNA helicase DeaD
MAEIAAAAARLAGGDRPLEVPVEPGPEQLGRPSDGMVRLFIDVGRNGDVGPSDVVGAIANEGGVPGKEIGAIDVHDRFTLVDLPTEYVEQVIRRMRGSRVRNFNANIRVVAAGERDGEPRARPAKVPGRPKAQAGARKSRPKYHRR